jgi:uncharacterized protein (TIGR02246 family)
MCRQYLPPHRALISRASEQAVESWEMEPVARLLPAAVFSTTTIVKHRKETMKIRLVVALLGLAISFTVPTLAQQKGTVDPQIDQQIRALAQKYDEAINKHDPAAVAALYTQDAVRVTALNDGTFHGRQAIEKGYAKYDFGRWQVTNYFTKVNRVTAVGNDVRSTGTWSSVFYRDADRGHQCNGDGYCSWVIVREGDTWKIRRDNASGGANPFGVNFN